MHIAKVHRQAYTWRVTVPKHIAQALNLQPNKMVLFEHLAPGIVTMRNAEDLINAGKEKVKT